MCEKYRVAKVRKVALNAHGKGAANQPQRL
jgi:hypothetical protein